MPRFGGALIFVTALVLLLPAINCCGTLTAGVTGRREGSPGKQGPTDQPMEQPRTEQKPTGCAGVTCLNGGSCFTSSFTVVGQDLTRPQCNCTSPFKGPFCEMSVNDLKKANDEREAKQGALVQAAAAGKQLEDRKKNCTSEDKKMLCPPADMGTGSQAGQCVGATVECFANSTALAIFKQEKERRCNATAGEIYCDQEGMCLKKPAQCAPAEQCPRSKPFRCPSWACATDAAGCEASGGVKIDSCASRQIRCPDGLCYTGTDMKDCAKGGILWEGCPPGLMECTGRTGMCGKDANECTSKVGCDPGLVFCGMKRDAEGKAVKDAGTGTALSHCVAPADCKVGQERVPVPTTKILDAASGGSLEALAADGKQAMKLKVPAGGFKVGGEMKAVNFSIAKVSDSLVQQGSFGKLFQSGALVGSLITIEPSAAVDVIGGMSLDIPILDQSASTDAAKCALLLKSLQMLSVNDISDVNAVPTSMGNCSKGELEGGSCCLLLLLPLALSSVLGLNLLVYESFCTRSIALMGSCSSKN